MINFEKGYYAADTINGVHFIGSLLEEDYEVISAMEFVYSLKTLDDNSLIIAFFDESTEEILKAIDPQRARMR